MHAPQSGNHDNHQTPVQPAAYSCPAEPCSTKVQVDTHDNQYGMAYRDYNTGATAVRPCVAENYRLNHMNQTHEFVTKCHERWSRFDTAKMSVWDAIELLNEVVDDSDPDTALPQIQHLLQTAEATRKAHPDTDWLHLVGLIHDLGKVMAHPRWGSEPQWSVVGDIYPTGCAHDPRIIFYKEFESNPDTKDDRYSSKYGVYSPGCGLKNVKMAWGHDEYFYQVLAHNGTLLPPEALFCIRYHSFYALHQHDAYGHLLNDEDRSMVPWLKAFQKCDLYSKTDEELCVEKLKPYYMGLIKKYFPNDVLMW
eukprot:jgi/Chrzof1/14688/Cz09g12040.t1